MQLIMIIIIFIILFGSSQSKNFLWGIVGLIFLLIAIPKNLMFFLLVIMVGSFIIMCFKSTIEEDFKELDQNDNIEKQSTISTLNSEQLHKTYVATTNQLDLKSKQLKAKNIILEREYALSLDYNNDFEDFIKDFGIPTHISVINNQNSLAFYKNLDIIVIYNPITKKIIKRESTR